MSRSLMAQFPQACLLQMPAHQVSGRGPLVLRFQSFGFGFSGSGKGSYPCNPAYEDICAASVAFRTVIDGC